MTNLNSRLTKLESNSGAEGMIVVYETDGAHFWQFRDDGIFHQLYVTLDPANLPEGVTHYTRADLDEMAGAGVQVIIVSFEDAQPSEE